MKRSAILLTTITLAATLLLGACSRSSSVPVPSPEPTKGVTQNQKTQLETTTGKLKANYELVASKSGQLALELLAENAEVETKDYGDAGKFITAINGLPGNNEYYWAFYINGEYAEKGASQTVLSKGDTVKFVYEAVTVTTK